MVEALSLQGLVKVANDWCAEHSVEPISGQAGELVSERNIRYYRTLGLIDAPAGASYGEKHLLQITAIRLLQAQGQPLRRIRELLYGRSLADLREIRRRGVVEIKRESSTSRVILPSCDELWRAIPVGEDFLLISRNGTPITPAQRDAVLVVLQSGSPVSPKK